MKELAVKYLQCNWLWIRQHYTRRYPETGEWFGKKVCKKDMKQQDEGEKTITELWKRLMVAVLQL